VRGWRTGRAWVCLGPGWRDRLCPRGAGAGWPRVAAGAVAGAGVGEGVADGVGEGDAVPDWLRALTFTTLATTSCAHPRQSRGYQPSPALRHLICIRNPTCTGPGRRAVTHCDLDHITPYDQGGRTCECNLHPRQQVITTQVWLSLVPEYGPAKRRGGGPSRAASWHAPAL
jgi:hypothetical protein